MPNTDPDADVSPIGYHVTGSFAERFDKRVAELAANSGLKKAKAKFEEALVFTLDRILSEYQLASLGKPVEEVIKEIPKQRKELLAAIESLKVKTRDLSEHVQSRRDITLSTIVALKDSLGINLELPPTLTDAERVEAGMSFYDANGQFVYGKGQAPCVVSLPAGTTSYRSKYSLIPQSARPVLELAEIVRQAEDVGHRIWSPNYQVVAQCIAEVDPTVTDEDCDAVNAIFDKPKYGTQRRVWEVFRNRLRRHARVLGDQEEAVMIIDFITDPHDIPKLWRRFARKSEKRWRPQRSMPWHCLLQFPFRKDLRRTDPLLLLQAGGSLCQNLTISVAPSTGYRAMVSPPDSATANRAIGELIAGASQWFNPFFILVEKTAIRLETSMKPSVPSPLESTPRPNAAIISRDDALKAVRRVAPDVGVNPELRVFRFKKNSKGFSDADFVVWPPGTALTSHSGTIVVGIKSQLFRINLSDWSVDITSVLDEEEARRTTAAHYRHLRAVYE